MSHCLLYEPLSAVWAIARCMSYCPLYETLSAVWAIARCMSHCSLHELSPAVWAIPRCMSHCLMYEPLPAVWAIARCMSHCPLYEPLLAVWAIARCMSYFPLYEPFLAVWAIVCCLSHCSLYELLIMRDSHCGRMCFKSVKTIEGSPFLAIKTVKNVEPLGLYPIQKVSGYTKCKSISDFCDYHLSVRDTQNNIGPIVCAEKGRGWKAEKKWNHYNLLTFDGFPIKTSQLVTRMLWPFFLPYRDCKFE